MTTEQLLVTVIYNMAKGSRVYIGFLGYGQSTAKYLPDFLDSLGQQTFTDIEIIAGDNTPTSTDNPNEAIIKHYSSVRYCPFQANLGFAKGYNRLFKLAIEEEADYFLVINPDTCLQPKTIEYLVNYLDQHSEAGAVMPKILRWDFQNKCLTKEIDSLGVALTQSGAFYDIGQGQLDGGELNRPHPIFGFTGAGVLLRLSALRSVAFDNGRYLEYFDELMFMYKEDCDLSYRLRLAGWETVLLPAAVIYHDRTAAKAKGSWRSQWKERRQSSKLIRRWSYHNQIIIFLKYYFLPKKLSTRLCEIAYQLKRLAVALILEPFILTSWKAIFKERSSITARRRALNIKIKPLSLEKWRQ